MVGLLLGILKGGVIGAAIGYFASQTGFATGALAFLLYGVIGAVVGLLCGRPVWRQETIWTSILKALVGFGVGVGAAFAGHKWLGGVHIPVAFIPGAVDHALPDVPALFGAAVGIVYGVLMEVDDASGNSSPAKEAATPKTR
ncbi:MAG: hypothetical protein H7X95_13395 [Deltaproteobacteria bacterium]|nr:hypothetical protein [Deltaproteobacteria bacterium]